MCLFSYIVSYGFSVPRREAVVCDGLNFVILNCLLVVYLNQGGALYGKALFLFVSKQFLIVHNPALSCRSDPYLHR